MSRAKIARLAAVVSDLRARKLAESAAPIAAAELEAAGFRVYRWQTSEGFAVDEAPGLSEKLDELRGRGIEPGVVAIIRKFDEEAAA